MTQEKIQEENKFEMITKDLCSYAVEREDIKWILGFMPQEMDLDINTIEYELQLLKIISVGWSISYYLQEIQKKNQIIEPFWDAVREFAGNLSQTTGLLIGQNIDYFQAIRERLDKYVLAMSKLPQDTDPIQAIGPQFAELCGDEQDIFARMAGGKMFTAVITHIKPYLEQAV